MSVVFTDASSTPISEPLRDAYQRVVHNALDLMRPPRKSINRRTSAAVLTE
jgi:hypothetical protein